MMMNDCIQKKSKTSEHASEACIFCKIIKGEIPCAKIYEDDNFLAFLDIEPRNKGHTLIIPKEHYHHFLDIPDKLMKEYSLVIKKIAKAINNMCDFVNIVMYGTDVPHAHIHVIPRFKGDGLHFWPGKKYEEGEMKEYQKKIKSLL